MRVKLFRAKMAFWAFQAKNYPFVVFFGRIFFCIYSLKIQACICIDVYSTRESLSTLSTFFTFCSLLGTFFVDNFLMLSTLSTKPQKYTVYAAYSECIIRVYALFSNISLSAIKAINSPLVGLSFFE